MVDQSQGNSLQKRPRYREGNSEIQDIRGTGVSPSRKDDNDGGDMESPHDYPLRVRNFTDNVQVLLYSSNVSSI